MTDLRVGCMEEFRFKHPRPPLVDVCWHHMAIRIKLAGIKDSLIHDDYPVHRAIESIEGVQEMVRAATGILLDNFGETEGE